MFYPQLFASFCDKNGNLAHNHRFLLHHETVEKTSEQHFPKQFKARYKSSSECDLKQQKLIGNAHSLSWLWLCSEPFNLDLIHKFAIQGSKSVCCFKRLCRPNYRTRGIILKSLLGQSANLGLV